MSGPALSLYQNLRREIQVHSPRVDDILERAGAIASIRTPEAEGVRMGFESLREMWDVLREETERRQQLLDINYQVQQYYFDVGEVETWLSEQELLMMNDEKGKVRFWTKRITSPFLWVYSRHPYFFWLSNTPSAPFSLQPVCWCRSRL